MDCRRLEDQWEKRRDHARVLDLPANVLDLRKESKCKWLKKQHKKLARLWHPDKARGDRLRAERKMREVSLELVFQPTPFACLISPDLLATSMST